MKQKNQKKNMFIFVRVYYEPKENTLLHFWLIKRVNHVRN